MKLFSISPVLFLFLCFVVHCWFVHYLVDLATWGRGTVGRESETVTNSHKTNNLFPTENLFGLALVTCAPSLVLGLQGILRGKAERQHSRRRVHMPWFCWRTSWQHSKKPVFSYQLSLLGHLLSPFWIFVPHPPINPSKLVDFSLVSSVFLFVSMWLVLLGLFNRGFYHLHPLSIYQSFSFQILMFDTVMYV